MLITRVWREQPGKYFCVSTKSGRGKWADHFFTKAEFKELPAFIEDNSDKDIYFCPHGFTEPRRQKTFAVPPKLLWSDMDEADPRVIKFKPTIAIESSPGRFAGLWRLDTEMDESINRRLSYTMGADKSGWDLTQVLRFPNTTNYKYTTQPRVRVLWSDGPSYRLKDIDSQLPKEVANAPTGEETDAAAIFKTYEKKLPSWLRRELISGKPTPGKRSEMLWKIGQTLVECGVSSEEIFVLLKASPWNKFAGRRSEDEQLQREVDKAINNHFRSSTTKKRREDPKEDDDEGRARLLFRSMDIVEEENIDWIWFPYLARGEMTVLEGDPGLGKSYLAQVVSAAICDGEKLPSVKRQKAVMGRVVYFDMENSAGTVTKKRLVENGLENLASFVQCEEPFSIDDDEAMGDIYDYFEKVKPTLAVFDTLNTYIGKADAFKGHEVQQAMGRFRELAKRFNCAVLVLRHLTKSNRERALYRGQGSISISGLARVVITVGVVPNEPELRAFAVTKINVAKPPKAMTFSIEELPDTVKSQGRSKFVWGDFVDLTSEDLVSAPEKEATNERDDAKKFLRETLAEGPIEISKLERMAEARSISKRTLYRASDALGLKKKSSGFGKERRSTWSLVGNEDEG